MSAALRLLTMICLLWCAFGGTEPVVARDVSAVEHVVLCDAAGGHTDTDRHEAPDGVHHHHCPVAPDAAAPVGVTPWMAAAVLPGAGLAPVLASLAGPPPLQPPAA